MHNAQTHGQTNAHNYANMVFTVYVCTYVCQTASIETTSVSLGTDTEAASHPVLTISKPH